MASVRAKVPPAPLDKSDTRAMAALALLTVALLLPFVGKAFHIDDPFYLWVAQHIGESPFDFFGFDVNWYGTTLAVAEVNKNPPLVSYYMALAACFLGWSEAALHLAFLPAAVGAVLGTYLLARRFTACPAYAALTALLAPAFLVSSTNVMAEVMMLCAYVWAILCWVEGTERRSITWIAVAGLLIVAATLTKYFAVSLLPLLLAYTVLRRRFVAPALIALAAACLLLGAYQAYTASLYGQGHLLGAMSFASHVQGHAWRHAAAQVLTGLAFTGGCLMPAALLAPTLWPKRVWIPAAIAAFALLLVLAGSGAIALKGMSSSATPHWLYAAQWAALVLGGLHIFVLCAQSLWRERDAESVLLCLWILGTFVFAAVANWSVNARSVLPMAPAAGMLVGRRIDALCAAGGAGPSGRRLGAVLVLSACVSLAVAWTDYRLANAGRDAAHLLRDRYAAKGVQVYFLGHWGFQYYMEEWGARPVDFERTDLAPGDIVVAPEHRGTLFPYDLNRIGEVEPVALPLKTVRWLSTWNPVVGAGFYADTWGALPFAAGSVPEERYNAVVVKNPFRFKQRPE